MITFFSDRDLGHTFPELLSRAGIAVERHDDHFGPTTTDVEWLRKAGKKGWFVLTHDQRIRYKPNERDAVMRAGVGMFVLVGKAPHPELAENFISTIDAVYRFIAKHPRPFIAKVWRPQVTAGGVRPGTVGMWLSKSEWKPGSRSR